MAFTISINIVGKRFDSLRLFMSLCMSTVVRGEIGLFVSLRKIVHDTITLYCIVSEGKFISH